MPEGMPRGINEKDKSTPVEESLVFERGSRVREVVFRRILDRKGNFVKNISSERGRKAIENFDSSIIPGRPYTVVVLGDSDPTDPLKGSYSAVLEQFASDPFDPDTSSDDLEEGGDEESLKSRHRAVLERRAERLQNSPAFQTLADMLKDPELRREYDLVLSRRKEILALQDSKVGERHRAFAPMFVGLMMGERTKPLLDMAIDKTVADRSRLIKEALSEGEFYVPEVIVGSGPHSAIYNLNRQMILPNDPSLTLEREPRIGGQFTQAGSRLFALNSRTRPMQRGAPPLPGSSQTLNTFSEMAVTSPADTGMETYQGQSVMGDHARLNLFLSGEPVTEARLRRVRSNPFGTPGSYVVEFVDEAENRILEVETDRIIFATGVGEEKTNLDERDETTRNILAAEREEFDAGEDARVLSFSQLTERIGNPENPFPLKKFRNVILSGDGDGAKVIAGIFLGYEGQLGMTSMQVDHVERIVWIGQQLTTKEAFLDACRARYHQLGLEFPRDKAEEYYARIQPVPDFRAERLEREGDDIVVVLNDGSTKLRGDHFIYAHGFSDTTNEALQYLNPSNTIVGQVGIRGYLSGEFAGPPYRSDIKGDLATQRVLFSYRTGPISRIELSSNKGGIEYTKINRDGSFETGRYARTSEFSAFIAATLAGELPSEVSKFPTPGSVIGSSPIPFVAEGLNSGAPIASKYPNREIYRIGPSAQLPVSRTERTRNPALRNIPENTAAVFRYAENTALLAKFLASRDAINVSSALFGVADERMIEEQKSQNAGPNQRTRDFLLIQGTERSKGERAPYAMSVRDILRFGIGAELESFIFPESSSEVRIRLEPVGDESFNAQVFPRVSVKQERALTQALSSPYTQIALQRLSGEAVGGRKRKGLTVVLPIQNQKLDVANVRYELSAGGPISAATKGRK